MAKATDFGFAQGRLQGGGGQPVPPHEAAKFRGFFRGKITTLGFIKIINTTY